MKGIIFATTLFTLLSCTSEPGKTDTSSPGEKGTATETTANPEKKTIVFFGNSLTAAYNLSPEQGFPALIQEKIDSLGLSYICVNAGLSGETTADGVHRIDWVLQQPMDVFVLELGGNDALRGLPIEESVKNMQTIVEKVKAARPNCKIVIAGMLAPPNLGAAYTNAFKNLFSDLAKRNGALLVPFLLKDVGGIPALNLGDGIHPNIAGQKIVAETVWGVLRTAL